MEWCVAHPLCANKQKRNGFQTSLATIGICEEVLNILRGKMSSTGTLERG